MPERSASPMHHDPQADYYGAQPLPVAWTPEQQVRLEHEWRQLQRNFAYHPVVRIVPVQGNPPAEYTVEFKARTLMIREDGQLDYTTTSAVHVWLPPGYPHDAPVVRPIQALFHPNVTMDGIVLNPPWDANRTLAQLVQQIGGLLAFHTYDPYSIWNPAAMEWVAANATYLPTDPNANFSPTAGGEPLGRICQRGKPSIDQLRGQLQQLCASLLTPDEPPSAAEVHHFAEQIRLATNLFLDDDVPDSLRGPATELDQWAETLPSATLTFESLRQRHLAVAAALAAAGKVADSRRLLLKEFASLDEMLSPTPSADPYAALGELPELARMQAVHANFKVVFTEAERRLAAARARFAALAPPDPRHSFTHSDLLEHTIEAETNRAAAAIRDAQEKTSAAIEALAPVVDRARDELAAFERVIGWREYADLTAKAHELVDRILAWGSAGAQAYFVENEGGAFGPYEFEQRLDLGDSALAVRNTGRTSLEVFDVNTGGKVGASDAGAVTVQLPGGEPGESYATTFRLTARCDDLWVQVEYLTRQVGELLGRLRKPLSAAKAQAWVAAYAAALADPAAMAQFVEDAKQGLLERNSLVSDLKLLARFKERMTTQLLLERYMEMIPRFKQELANAQRDLKDANTRIADIFSKSQREVETGQPMIPPRLAKEYDTQTRRRDDMQRTIARLNRRFATAIAQMTPRLSTPGLYGAADVPSPVILPPLPDDLLARAELMHEREMSQSIATLEQALSAKLRPDAPAPPPEPERAPEPPEYADDAQAPAAHDDRGEALDAIAEQSHDAPADPFAIQAEEHHEHDEADPENADWIDLNANPGKEHP